LGYDITPLRSRGSYISGTNGENQGAVFFWKLYNDMLVAVNQGGKRKGAGCAYLESWHGDLEDFLSLRKNTGDDRVRTHDMNTANWIPDLFMKQVLNDGPWYLFSPSEAPELHDTFGEEFESWYWHYVEKGRAGELDVFEEKSAKQLWKKMLRTLFETGHPWITFKDPSNIRYANQHEGIVHSSNLCTEILEHTKPSRYEDGKKVEIGETAVCNLASLNLKEHLNADGTLNWDMLGRTVTSVMRMLDNVIDINFYPTDEAQKSNQRHRYVGMGSMGWHDLFHARNIPIDSDDAVALSDEVYEFISRNAIMASSMLAKERGTYPSYEGSLWSKNIFPIDTYADVIRQRGDNAIQIGDMQESLEWTEVREHVKQHGMRNALTMAIAPTATISYIAGCAQSTEPNFSVLFVYSTLSGEFVLIDENFVNDMKALGKWDNDMIKLLKSVDGDVGKLPDSVVPPDYKAKYKTAFSCDQTKLLEAGAARQKWIDQGCSLNLYNNSTSLKFLNDLYTHAWQLGLKTTYYLRNMGASKIEKSTIDDNEVQRILAEKNGETGQTGIQSSGGDFECIGCQ
jgi:ribonucleoside-diphosphate reductase alpha chain